MLCYGRGEILGYHSPVNNVTDELCAFYIVCVCVTEKRYMYIYSICPVIVLMLHILYTCICSMYMCGDICNMCVMCVICAHIHIITRQMVRLFLDRLCPTVFYTSAAWSWALEAQMCWNAETHKHVVYDSKLLS